MLFLWMWMCTMGVPGAWSVRECFGSLGDGVREGCGPPCGCWELNLGCSERATSDLNC